MDKMGGGKEYHDFPSKIFCLSVWIIFTGITFSVSKFLGSENFMHTKETSQFSKENLLFHRTKNFVG